MSRVAAGCAAAVALWLAHLPAAAQSTTPATPEPASLGRLFFTPERRAAFDRQRELNVQESAPKIEDPTVSVSGVVRRSSGQDTAWINGAPQRIRAPDAIWAPGPAGQPGRVRLASPDRETQQVNVGETLYRSSGVIESPLQGGHVGVHRKPPGNSK